MGGGFGTFGDCGVITLGDESGDGRMAEKFNVASVYLVSSVSLIVADQKY